MIWPWMHPQIATENYLKAVSNFTDTSIAAAKTTSEMAQIMMEAERTSIDIAKNNTKALSRYFVESAKSFEDASTGAYEGSRR